MKTLGYYNGSVGELEEMQIPMLDRACYFGDGVYDVTYSRNYHIYALEEHIDRFFTSAEQLKIVPSISKQELRDLLNTLCSRLDCGNQWVYFQFSRGTAPRSHAFPNGATANLLIMLKPAEIRDTYATMRCITLDDTRFYHCNIKTLNLIPNVLATQATVEAGVDEAILHRGEFVTECAHSNISILSNGALITHPADHLILAGTGRAHLLNACQKRNIPIIERRYTLTELLNADEILITSASALCMRVVEVDGKPVGGKDMQTVKCLQDDLLQDFLSKTE
ncbi:MAG: D-amino acid aminotransferase [Ruminococcaceae bacterium]|nr:D-amino acid aminotransferase [Oscillospiraceae bacterium]